MSAVSRHSVCGIFLQKLKLRPLPFLIWKTMDLHEMIWDSLELHQPIIIKERTDYHRSRVREFQVSHWLIHTRDIKCHAEKTRVRNRSKWNSENRNHHKSMNREGGLRKPLFEADDSSKHVWELGCLSQSSRGRHAGSNPFRYVLWSLISNQNVVS